VRPKHPQEGLTYYLSRQLKTFDDISSVLTLSSPSRLNLPEVYDVAKENLSSFFPHAPTPFYEFGQLEEALILAIEHDVKTVRDGLPVVDVILFLDLLVLLRPYVLIVALRNLTYNPLHRSP